MSTAASHADTDTTWSVSLIQTKITPPRLPRGCVERRALHERLSPLGGRTLIVVSAPAGFGKTTLLAEWCQQLTNCKNLVAWLSVDDEDVDPYLFASYLVASMCRATGEVGEQAQRLLHNNMLTPINTVISVLLNEIVSCGRQIFLALDDVDRLTAKPIIAILSRLLQYAPENLHVLVSARSDPTSLIGRFATSERLVRVYAEHLRFTVEDAQAFFSQVGKITLDRSSVKLLNDATEGWVAGLQLASLALREEEDASKVAAGLSGARIGINSYLDSTVLADLPAEILDFLLRTSILERMSAEVCDAVMGSSGQSWEKLEWLERHNIFIRPLDDESQWFRYHALLGEALRRRVLRQHPDEVPVMHRRASQWFADARLWPEAVKHALAAGDLQQAVQWVENCAVAMVELGDAYTVLGWIARIPPELVDGRLRLRVAKALALTLAMQSASALQEIHAVAAAIDTNAMETDARDALLAEVNSVSSLIAIINDNSDEALALGLAASATTAQVMPWVKRFAQVAKLYGFLYAGNFDEVRRMWALAVPHSIQSEASTYEDIYREYLYGLALLLQGRLSEGVIFLDAAVSRAETYLGRNSGVVAGLSSCLSAICYEHNDLLRAGDLIRATSAMAMEACPSSGLLRYTCTAARLYARSGDMGSALAVLEDGRQIAAKRPLLRYRVACDAESARLFILDGRKEEARRIVTELGTTVHDACRGRRGTFLETWTIYQTLLARVMIAEGAADQAVALLAPLLADIAAVGWRYHEAIISVLLAQAFEKNGALRESLALVGRGMAIAQNERMVNIFVDEGPALQRLIEQWRRNLGTGAHEDKEFTDRLLSAFVDSHGPSPAPPRATHAAAGGILSSRELEVLDCVARGLSNKEIGRELQVTPETVKWHLKNIFEKLDVTSRIEAVHQGLWQKSPPNRVG